MRSLWGYRESFKTLRQNATSVAQPIGFDNESEVVAIT